MFRWGVWQIQRDVYKRQMLMTSLQIWDIAIWAAVKTVSYSCLSMTVLVIF